jgi:hypothetical protein
MHKFWERFLCLLDNDISTKIFDNIKNLLVCALLFAAGTNALKNGGQIFFDLTASNLAGWGIIAISAILTLLNVCDGLRKLAKLRYHTALQIVLFLAYVLVAGRIVEVVWNFRA